MNRTIIFIIWCIPFEFSKHNFLQKFQGQSVRIKFYEYTRKAVQTQLKPYTLISNLFERLDEIKKLLTRSYYFICWKATSEGMRSVFITIIIIIIIIIITIIIIIIPQYAHNITQQTSVPVL